MNAVEKNLLSLIYDLVSADVIRKETIIETLTRNCISNPTDVLPITIKEKVVSKLISCNAISNQNFRRWLKNNGCSNIKATETLNLCLRKGVFEYTVKKEANRVYYVKGNATVEPTTDWIVWR